jgi:hypothetical protein
MNFPTTRLSGGSSPNFKDKIRWFSSSVEEAFAPKSAGKQKGSFTFIVN